MDASGQYSTDIRAEALTLSRGGRIVANGLSLVAGPGEAVLLTGRNGAGKTTLLRALSGLLRPDAGTVSFSGAPARQAGPMVTAWLGHADGLKPGETVREAVEFAARLYGRDLVAADSALEALAIDALDERPCGRLSRGQSRRVALARVLLSGRPVWLLDEPAGPLDAAGRDLLAQSVASHRAQGGVVIAATHQTLDWPGAQVMEIGA